MARKYAVFPNRLHTPYAIALNPFAFTRLSSLSDGPSVRFLPRSHLLTASFRTFSNAQTQAAKLFAFLQSPNLRRAQRFDRCQAQGVELAHRRLIHQADLARFRANSIKSTGRDFPSMVEAEPWLAARIGVMPAIVVLMPYDNQKDFAPAVLVDARAALKVILEEPAFPFRDSCSLFAPIGTSMLEVSPEHTRDGDVITVRFWGPMPDTV